jgi:hypothetical protein
MPTHEVIAKDDGHLKDDMELVEAPANDVNYGIDGGCKKEDNGVTQQDEFFSHTGFDDNLTLDNYTVARPNDPDYFLTQETEFDRDSGEFLMDYIATQEAEVLPPSNVIFNVRWHQVA